MRAHLVMRIRCGVILLVHTFRLQRVQGGLVMAQDGCFSAARTKRKRASR